MIEFDSDGRVVGSSYYADIQKMQILLWSGKQLTCYMYLYIHIYNAKSETNLRWKYKIKKVVLKREGPISTQLDGTSGHIGIVFSLQISPTLLCLFHFITVNLPFYLNCINILTIKFQITLSLYLNVILFASTISVRLVFALGQK